MFLGYFCSCWVAKSCLILCNPMHCNPKGFSVLFYLPEFAQTHAIESVMLSNHLTLTLPSLPLLNMSQHQNLFQWVNWLHQLVKYWSFYFSISPSNIHSGLIPFKMDWVDFLVVRRALRSLLQHHNLKASVHQRSSFFMDKLSEAKWTGKFGYNFYGFYLKKWLV